MFTEKTKRDLLPKQPLLPRSLLTSESVTCEVNQLHVAETQHAGRACNALSLMEGSPLTHQCATAPPNHIIHPTASQISHSSPAWRPETSGALRREPGPRPRRPRPRWAEHSLKAVTTRIHEHQSQSCDI